MKVYIAKHKITGKKWGSKRIVYESKGGLKSSMKTSYWNVDREDYDIYEYELKNGEIVK